MMVYTTRSKQTPVPKGFMPATQLLTAGALASVWQDMHKLQRKCWHRWLDMLDELSYALAFYQEWHRRHKL